MNVKNIANFELFLLNLRYREGGLITVEANKPLMLTDSGKAWVVYSGTVDVFSVPIEGNEPVGTRQHIFRGTAGQLLLGIDSSVHQYGLLASGSPGTRLIQIRLARLQEMAKDIEYHDLIVAMLEDWVVGLSSGVTTTVLPKDYLLLEPNKEEIIKYPQVATVKKDVLWVQQLAGESLFLSNPDVLWLDNESFLPLVKGTWVEAVDEAKFRGIDTNTIVSENSNWQWIDFFHGIVLETIVFHKNELTEFEHERLREKAKADQSLMEKSILKLISPLADETLTTFVEIQDDYPLLAACRLVGNHLGLDIRMHPRIDLLKSSQEYVLRSIVRTSRVELREVALRGNWWKNDSGALLGFTNEQEPVAILPISANRYEIVNPTQKNRQVITSENVKQLSPIAYSFYRSLPNRVLNAQDLIKLGYQDIKSDLWTMLITGVIVALIGLVPPLAISLIFDSLIPDGRINDIWQIGVGLLLLAVTMGIFRLVRGIAVLRIQSKMDSLVQAALWERLLSLPVPFYKEYSAGDLGTRAMSINQIRRALSGSTAATFLNSIFSFVYLILLFIYSVPLALIAIGLVLLALFFTFIFGRAYIRVQRSIQEVRSKVAGSVLQLLTGVMKFRVAGAEHVAFSLWSDAFIKQKNLYYKARSVTNRLATYNASYPIVASMCIFGMMAFSTQFELSLGDFLAFNLAFAQFFNAWFVLGIILINLLSIVPTYELLHPILTAKPEVDESKQDPGDISGEIEVSHVSFRYQPNGPLVLTDVSFQIKSGEFVAFVGSSGSGKSTMLRLLLGFARPESGGIYYDNKDLAELDLQEVRQQIGVVLQSAMLMTGDIYSNLAGSLTNLTIDDAWEAARMSGVDEDIKRMPMGMHTVISERGSNLSGGQRQRMLIARALINKPRILFFDEATSALDNRTQSIVSESLDNIQATRIVIAHRLSTIINADRIYVFDKGKIVQVGTYDTLMREPGVFSDLAKRQIA